MTKATFYASCVLSDVFNLTKAMTVTFIENSTLVDELNHQYHDYFSYEILKEYPAGPGRYLILVSTRFQTNYTVMDNV